VVLQVQEVDAHVGELADLGEHLGDETPGHVHALDLRRRLEFDHEYLTYIECRYFYTDTLALAGIEIPVVS
jgi:hypothetical protein